MWKGKDQGPLVFEKGKTTLLKGVGFCLQKEATESKRRRKDLFCLKERKERVVWLCCKERGVSRVLGKGGLFRRVKRKNEEVVFFRFGSGDFGW